MSIASCRSAVLRVSCCSKCLFLYGPFCYGVLELDLSSLFATFFSLNISSIYIKTNVSNSVHHQQRTSFVNVWF